MVSGGKEYKKAISYIRELVGKGELMTGSRLPTERAISETLGISRNSTREALRTLENMGVTKSKHGSGNYISGNMSGNLSEMIEMMLFMQTTSTDEVCAFRRSMEKTVCDLIMANPNADMYLNKIPGLLDDFIDATHQQQIELDRNFHFLLIHATGNRLMIMMMEALTDVYRKWINSTLALATDSIKSQLKDTHYAIYDGLIKRDHKSCMSAVTDHYDLIDRELTERQ